VVLAWPFVTLVQPLSSDFTAWVYQGNITVADLTAGMQFTTTSIDGDLHMLGVAPPSTPWTMICGFVPSISYWHGITGGPSVPTLLDGIGMSDGTKFLTLFADYLASRFDYMSASNYKLDESNTVKSVGYATSTPPPIVWLKITDDGADRNFYICANPLAGWLKIYTEVSNTYLTPTLVGPVFWPEAGNAGTWKGGVYVDWLLTGSIV
jgi:hypothetical protein